MPYSLCDGGVRRFIPVPKAAKKLHIRVYSEQPSEKLSNLLEVRVEQGDWLQVWEVDGAWVYASYVVRPFLRQLASQNNLTVLFISFDYS